MVGKGGKHVGVAAPEAPSAHAAAPVPAQSSSFAEDTPGKTSVVSDLAPKYVHHSYMWLGSLRVAGIILFATVVSMGSSLMGVIAEGETSTPEGMRITVIIFGLCALLMLAIIAAVVVYQVVSYKHLYYEVGENEFNLYKGVLSKKRIHIPYQRIQSVDQRASLVQRIVGVCTVSIDTAGGSSNKAVQIPYLTKQDAELLRVELFARKRYAEAVAAGKVSGGFRDSSGSQALSGSKALRIPQTPGGSQDQQTWRISQASPVGSAGENVLDAPADVWEQFGGVFGGDAVDTGAVSFEYGLTNKELVLTGLSNNTAFALVVIGVLGSVMQLGEALLSAAPVSGGQMVDALIATSPAWAVGSALTAVVAALVGIVLFIWLMSAVGACISYGGFRACRRGSRIEVERGLLQHQFQGVDIDRVQSVTIKQSFIRRLMGYCEVSVGKVDATAEGEGSQENALTQGLVIHPFVKVDRVADVLAGIIPEYADVPREAWSVAPVAKRRAIIRRGIVQGFGFWSAVIIAAGQVSAHAVAPVTGPDFAAMMPYVDVVAFIGYVFALALLAIDVIGAILWARESSFAVNDAFMQVSNGGLSRETVSFPRAKIQFGYTKANPLQRRAKTATINARTAAGVGGTTIRLIDVREEDANAWLAWLKPRGNMVE